MSYTTVFNGSPVQPSEVSYRAISLTADATLTWPSSYTDTTSVVTRTMDVTPSAAGFSLTMPDATEVSVGTDSLIRNRGSDSFTLKDSSGATIGTMLAGTAYYLYLTDNSTAAGTWQIIQFGVGTGNADAASLAGAGLTASAGLLNQSTTVYTKAANYTVVNGDRATTIVWTGGAGTLSLTAVATLGNGFFVQVANYGTGTLTVDPDGSETIDGASTKSIAQNESCAIICSGSAWYTVGYGRAVSSSVTRLVKSVAGSSDVTLTTAEGAYLLQEYTGTLTGNINVIVPTTVAQFHVFNNTAGAFTLTVKTAAGTGQAVTQGTRALLDCDGTNVVSALGTSAGTVTSVATGTGLTGGPITSTGTVSLANTAVAAGTYNAATITVDAQGRVTAASDSDVRSLVQWAT